MLPNNRKTPVFYSLIVGSIMAFWSCNAVDIAISDPIPNCQDGILNQGEIETDCGGPCPACPSKMTANVNGMNWESSGSVTTQINGSSIIILSGNGTSNMSLIYNGPFTIGSYNLANAIYTINATSANYITNTGNITFTNWDQSEKLLYGTFNFKAFESSGSGDSVNVTQGKFIFVPY